MKISTGLIIQFGVIVANATITITFPTTFTNSTSYSIVKNRTNNATSSAGMDTCNFYTLTAVSAITRSLNNTSDRWLALGY